MTLSELIEIKLNQGRIIIPEIPIRLELFLRGRCINLAEEVPDRLLIAKPVIKYKEDNFEITILNYKVSIVTIDVKNTKEPSKSFKIEKNKYGIIKLTIFENEFRTKYLYTITAESVSPVLAHIKQRIDIGKTISITKDLVQDRFYFSIKIGEDRTISFYDSLISGFNVDILDKKNSIKIYEGPVVISVNDKIILSNETETIKDNFLKLKEISQPHLTLERTQANVVKALINISEEIINLCTP